MQDKLHHNPINSFLGRVTSGWFSLCLAAMLYLPRFVAAQDLFIRNGVVTYSGLTNTTVTMTGRSELRLTATTGALSGCLVNLDSPDAWLFLLNIKPSAAAGCLGQLRVNGAAAVVDFNVRLVQYGMGAVIIPHPSNLQPLQAFSGPHFTGTSALLSQYTAYNSSNLGALNGTIGSFRLKRGYMATLAEKENGTGASQCFVAQEGDLEVSLLPASLDDKVHFVRVFPWRWTSKKGVAGNLWQNLNVRWFYNWNLDQNSSPDVEYVAIRQTQWWPSLDQNWRTRGINHLLGFNEPDNPEQSNLSVADALSYWPMLLATGLRVGAPAVTDGGASWLYSFIDQADAAGLRVDFVPLHYYRCYGDPTNPDGAATQFYNFLKDIYDRVKRPLWVTEWNNGADWTSCVDPTYAQQQAAVAKMIEMLDNAPFVERYAIYNWVEDVRRVQWDDGSLTSAGVTYRDKMSPISYVQALPDNGRRSLAQFQFENTSLDGSGFGNNALLVGSPTYGDGRVGQCLLLDGTNNLVQLPPNIARSAAFSFAAWVFWEGGGSWQRIFDFGNDTTHYLCLTPRSSSNTMRFILRNGGGEQFIETAALPANQWCHVAVTLSGSTGRLYVNGVQVAISSAFSITPAQFKPQNNYFGKSQFPADPLFKGRLDEVLITDYALTAAQIAGLQTNQPPQFSSNVIAGQSGWPETPYRGNLAGTAFDPNPADALTYSKATGPAWLTVAANGTLGGTPSRHDTGTNLFTVRVTDPAGASAFAILTVVVPNPFCDGAWGADIDGFWGDTNLWRAGLIANGAAGTADFSSLNITANRVITVETNRSIGTLKFGDLSGYQSWTLVASNDSLLTLDTQSATQPVLLVTNTATFALPVAGTNGFLKSGPGTLVLTATNPLCGTLKIDSGSAADNDGAVRVENPGALSRVSAIQIRNTFNGSSTLQLDGSNGALYLPAQLAVSGRDAKVPAIQNLSGTNTFSGFVGLEAGGTVFTLQSDAGLLIFNGNHQYVGSSTGRCSYVFSGAGDHLLRGSILNATNGTLITLAKIGLGTLTVSGVNTYANPTTVSAGTLLVNGSLTASPVTLAGPATLGGSGILGAAVIVYAGATLSPGLPPSPGNSLVNSIGKLTVNNNLTLQPGSFTRMKISKSPPANDQLCLTGTLTYGGTLVVTNLSGTLAAGDSFRLFQAGAFAGAFASYVLPALPPVLGWDTTALTNGVLSVVRTVASSPPNLTGTLTGNSLTLSWPETHMGWRLQVQTNVLDTNWFTLPGSEVVCRWSLPCDTTLQGMFFRLIYP